MVLFNIAIQKKSSPPINSRLIKTIISNGRLFRNFDASGRLGIRFHFQQDFAQNLVSFFLIQGVDKSSQHR